MILPKNFWSRMPARHVLTEWLRFANTGASVSSRCPPRAEVMRSVAQLLQSMQDDEEETWLPFERADVDPEAYGEQRMREISQLLGVEMEEVRKQIGLLAECDHWKNNLYQVAIWKISTDTGVGPDMWHLSIKRTDQKALRDWRHLQRIKNELVGPECEGVELYPAESRVVDTANQFHLWVVNDPEFRFPIGFQLGAKIGDNDPISGAVQRKMQ